MQRYILNVAVVQFPVQNSSSNKNSSKLLVAADFKN